MTRNLRYGLLLAACALAVPQSALAEWQPKGPITLMIGFQAGGTVDTQARLVAEELEARKGWKVIPESVVGRGGGVLAARLAKAPADGTAIGLIVSETVGYNMLADKKPGYSEKDFTYLTTTSGTQFGVVAKKSRGWKTLPDLTAAMKKGEKISFAVMTPKLADVAYLLGKSQGVQYNIVTLNGGKAVLDALVAGDVDAGWVAGPQARAVQAGDLVNLASGESTRLKMSPDAPTLKELGFNADLGVYFLLVAPKGLPADAREALTTAIKDIVNDPKSKTNAYIMKTAGETATLSGAELESYVAEQIVTSKALLEAAQK